MVQEYVVLADSQLWPQGEREFRLHIYQGKYCTPWRKQACFEISKVVGCFPALRVHVVACSGPVQRTNILFILRIEHKEMENKPPMEVIVEEGGENRRKIKLKDQPDEEGARGRYSPLWTRWYCLVTYILTVNKASVWVTFLVGIKTSDKPFKKGDVSSCFWLVSKG